jgi:hypothetical protein
MRIIDGKYKTSGDITKLDGTPVPDDEPLFLFRAHDKLLVQLLEYYMELCKNAGSPEAQINLLNQRIGEIKSWQSSHQNMLKIPD